MDSEGCWCQDRRGVVVRPQQLADALSLIHDKTLGLEAGGQPMEGCGFAGARGAVGAMVGIDASSPAVCVDRGSSI